MTTEEMSLEFDLLYNNIASNKAPGIDEYEKSVFLTKAQESIVTTIYDGTFEGNEKLREAINVLVTTKVFNSSSGSELNPPIGVSANSKFFKLPDNTWYIVYEALSPISSDNCINGKEIPIKPIKVDEYQRVSKNPFRRARNTEALRLNSDNLVEIVSTFPDYDYKVRYIRKPNPIIINTGNSQLYIDGYATDLDMPCELSDIIHRTIVDAAVLLAINAYNLHAKE